MTNLEKWKKKIAEAKDGEDFIYQRGLMKKEFFVKQCCPSQDDNYCDEFDDCNECKARWLDMEAEENEE